MLPGCPLPEYTGLADELHRAMIQLLKPDFGMPFIHGCWLPSGCQHTRRGHRRQRAGKDRCPGRFPASTALTTAGRIRRRHNEVALFRRSTHQRIDHIESPPVITNGRRIQPTRGVHTIQGQLRGPIQDMSQLAPVDEVTAVENRQTWKIFKRGVHQVIVLAHPTDGWVRIKAWQNRVTKCSGKGWSFRRKIWSGRTRATAKAPMRRSQIFVILDCPEENSKFPICRNTGGISPAHHQRL